MSESAPLQRPAPPVAKRDSRYRRSLRALSFIDNVVATTGRLPSVHLLLEHTGGSMRDAQRVHKAAALWLAQLVRLSVTTHTAENVEALARRVSVLEAENHQLRHTAERLENEHEGLRRHLLLETARLRDELVTASTGLNTPTGPSPIKTEIVARHHPVGDDAIFEESP